MGSISKEHQAGLTQNMKEENLLNRGVVGKGRINRKQGTKTKVGEHEMPENHQPGLVTM